MQASESLELKSQLEATKAQEKVYEARVLDLEEKLRTACRERDEIMDQFEQYKKRKFSRSLSGLSQDAQQRTGSSLQPLESVASMSEPSRVTLNSHGGEVHRTVPLEYVSSMKEPTRDTLTQVHRKMQEQQQQQHQQQQLEELHHLDVQQLMQLQQQHHLDQQQQHHMDLQHQHSNNISQQLDLRSSPAVSNLEFQSQQHLHYEDVRQRFEIQSQQQKEHQLPGSQQQSLHMDMVLDDRQFQHSLDVDTGSDAKSTSWNNFSTTGHLDMDTSDPCLILDQGSESMHIKLARSLSSQALSTQGLPSQASLVDPRSSPSSHFDDLQQQLQQRHQQQQQDDNMQLHLQQVESDDILSHIQQQVPVIESHSLHLPEEKTLRRQLSKRQENGLPSLSVGLQGGGNDDVISMAVALQQQQQQQQQQLSSAWPVRRLNLGSSASQISNRQNGIITEPRLHLSTGQNGITEQRVHLLNGQNGLTEQRLHMSNGQNGIITERLQMSNGQNGILSERMQLSNGQNGITTERLQLSNGHNGIMTERMQLSNGHNGIIAEQRMLSSVQNGISEQRMQLANGQNGISCLQKGSVVASILTPLGFPGDSATMLTPRLVHLPEPPEADPQVMLSTLPEKGKLLQAVIQAGPLLQSLLLAGPLPQWRHPPPPMDAEEIPRVNMSAGTVGVSMGATGGVSMGATVGVSMSMGASVGIMPSGGEQGIRLMASHGSHGSLDQMMRLNTPIDQVMRLNAPLQSSPSHSANIERVLSMDYTSFPPAPTPSSNTTVLMMDTPLYCTS